jgi:hypothetical protein
VVRASVQANPTDLELVVHLRELALLKKENDLVALADDVIMLLSGGKAEPWPGDIVPDTDLDGESIRRHFIHPSEKNAISRVAEMAGEIVGEVISGAPHVPKVSRKTRASAEHRLRHWITSWGRLLGYDEIEIHLTGESAEGSVALSGRIPSLALGEEVQSPLGSKHRFYLLRNLWRSARGLGPFVDRDLTGPVNWVVAISAAVLGERIELPVPAEASLLAKAKKALPRRLRRSLKEPCSLVLKENRKSLRAWAEGGSFSAERFGLLAATRVSEAISLIVEETAGESGLAKLAEDPKSILNRIPRCRELIAFALSEAYVSARRRVGVKLDSQGVVE